MDSSSKKLDTTYYLTDGEEAADTTYGVRDGLPESDNDEVADDSETEAVWSDMDLEANNQ